jgi:regulatory protein
MKITKLEYQKKNPDRVNIYVDDKFAVGIGVNDVVELGLSNNQEISQEELNKIIESSSFGKAFNAALNFLSFRPRSEFEARQYLKRKKVEDIDGVIEKLKKINQINDENFATWWIDQRNTFRQKGSRLISLELRQKGINKETVDLVMASKKDPISERERAFQAVQKKLRLWDKNLMGENKWREKIMRFLFSRGFDFDTVEEVIAKIGKSE